MCERASEREPESERASALPHRVCLACRCVCVRGVHISSDVRGWGVAQRPAPNHGREGRLVDLWEDKDVKWQGPVTAPGGTPWPVFMSEPSRAHQPSVFALCSTWDVFSSSARALTLRFSFLFICLFSLFMRLLLLTYYSSAGIIIKRCILFAIPTATIVHGQTINFCFSN